MDNQKLEIIVTFTEAPRMLKARLRLMNENERDAFIEACAEKAARQVRRGLWQAVGQKD